jgi:hypothetical protein
MIEMKEKKHFFAGFCCPRRRSGGGRHDDHPEHEHPARQHLGPDAEKLSAVPRRDRPASRAVPRRVEKRLEARRRHGPPHHAAADHGT